MWPCRIIPDCYRKNFPVRLKSHRSHDIVLLCIDCHDRAHTAAERLKRRIADTYNVPVQPSHCPPEVPTSHDPRSETSPASVPDAASGGTAPASFSLDAGPGREGCTTDAGPAGEEAPVDDGAASDGHGQPGEPGLGRQGTPGPLYVRKAALTLERQPTLPDGRRREFEGDIIRCGNLPQRRLFRAPQMVQAGTSPMLGLS